MSDIVNRLRHRAKTKNGSVPVGGSDGGTYTIGYYDQFAANDDIEAASRIEQLELQLASARSEARKEALDDLLADVEALDGARHLMQWMDMSRPTEQSLLYHCARIHRDPPTECRDVDHVPPKALRTLWILREVVAAHRALRLAEQEGTE